MKLKWTLLENCSGIIYLNACYKGKLDHVHAGISEKHWKNVNDSSMF